MRNVIINVELLPDGKGGWKIVGHYDSPREPKIFGHYRLKRNAFLIARGIAMGLMVELRVKKRNGRYTTEAVSFGHDPRSSKG